MHGLYAIVDAGALDRRRLDPVAFAEAVLSVLPAALQLRAKRRLGPRDARAAARARADVPPRGRPARRERSP